MNERVKDALDPRGILSPGKQGIWPERYRDGKGGEVERVKEGVNGAEVGKKQVQIASEKEDQVEGGKEADSNQWWRKVAQRLK